MPGPGNRTSLDAVLDWIDQQAAPLPAEEAAPTDAVLRILAEPVIAPADVPRFDEVAVDGLAVRAEETIGASTYSPVSFRIGSPGASLSPLSIVPVTVGDPLPQGADAVVLREHVSPGVMEGYEISEPTASGSGVVRQGHWTKLGSTLLPAGRQVRFHDVGVLLAAGIEGVRIIRQPRVRILLTGPRQGSELAEARRDANGPLLQELIARDGGTLEVVRRVERDRTALSGALSALGPDLILVVGCTGAGADDCAPLALADAGQLAIHGVALNPGETTGLGRTASGVLVVLLPGSPSACLWAYELLASRAVRRFAGRNPALPFPSKKMRTQRKIVSSIGLAEVCLVRCQDGAATPISSVVDLDPLAVAHADGFIVVAEGSEGYREGSTVTVHILRSYGVRANEPGDAS